MIATPTVKPHSDTAPAPLCEGWRITQQTRRDLEHDAFARMMEIPAPGNVSTLPSEISSRAFMPPVTVHDPSAEERTHAAVFRQPSFGAIADVRGKSEPMSLLSSPSISLEAANPIGGGANPQAERIAGRPKDIDGGARSSERRDSELTRSQKPFGVHLALFEGRAEVGVRSPEGANELRLRLTALLEELGFYSGIIKVNGVAEKLNKGGL